MGVLDFRKPKKLRPTDVHNKIYQSDTEIAGTYVPNMSTKDMHRWKAKHIKGNNERIEVRKTIGGCQMLLVILKRPGSLRRWEDPHVMRLSANGTLKFNGKEVDEFIEAIAEARQILGV